jgi:fatty-acyl-CoA synthase
MTSAAPALDDHERLVVDVIRELLAEADPAHASRRVGLDQSLTRELSIGSLERVELVLRLERTSGVALPETVLADADTPRELAAALARASTSESAATGAGQPRAPAHRVALAPAATGSGRAAPASTPTLVHALRWHAETWPDRVHIVLREESGDDRPITYGELWREGAAVAAGLRGRGVGAGERVALLLRTERAFFDAYVGILLAGGVPVPLYPPFRADQIEAYAARQAGILRNAEARILLTFSQAQRAAALLRPLAPSLTDIVTVDEVKRPRETGAFPSVGERDLALIQYTSGSTGSPKGVALSHANLIANIRAFGEAFAVNPDDVCVTWLPLYHDMGLIGTWLGPLYHGVPTVVMSPLAFLSRPARWLQAFHTHRGTLSAAPNFAYDLCVRKITDEEMSGVDLRSWRCALNGAEAVIAPTIERFTARFSPFGFSPETMKPVYGLAESSLCVTAPPMGRAPRIDRLARAPFERTRTIALADPADPQPLTFVGCGRALPHHEVRIVGDHGPVAGDRIEGRIEFRGPSAMDGYFRNAEATAAVRRDEGWIDTGDLGYWADGDLFVTGRLKDVIIAGGRNIYPQEVEEAVGDVPGVRRGCVAAFGVRDATTGTERLVIVAESRESDATAKATIEAAVTAAVVDTIAVPPDVVVIARPGAVPKTSSGKIRRNQTRDLYLAGALERGRASAAAQWARLIARDAWWRVSSAAGDAGRVLFTAWAWLMAAVLIPQLWALLAVAGNRLAARRVVSFFARLLLGVCGYRVDVAGAGAAGLSAAHPAVLVANHASYLDVVVLLSVLPLEVRFAAKGRLASYPLLGTLLRKAGYLLVQRGSASMASDLAATLRDGESLFIFPEGTFVRPPGVMPFRLGAFHAAAETGRPVIPVALSGTRTLWPDETLLLRRGRVTVTVGDPLVIPSGGSWRDLVALREAARSFIARHCGEPTVDRGLVMVDSDPTGHEGMGA